MELNGNAVGAGENGCSASLMFSYMHQQSIQIIECNKYIPFEVNHKRGAFLLFEFISLEKLIIIIFVLFIVQRRCQIQFNE